MSAPEPGAIRAAEVVLPCADLDATLAFFCERLGFRVDAVFPADAPTEAVVSGFGLTLRLRPGDGAPGELRLRCADPAAVGGGNSGNSGSSGDGRSGGARVLHAPNGTRVELVPFAPPLVLPPLVSELVVTRLRGDAPWVQGRAGMQYRDLIPGRQGGRFVASHIRIPAGGPVPDYVHFHDVHVQLIYCVAGAVRVVYEDQGPPFELRAGDCVLQPPRIRHRVLDCAPGLEVVEVSCPAAHETWADHVLQLPNTRVAPQREFGGQRFVRHVAAAAEWQRAGECLQMDLGIAAGSGSRAGARVVRYGAREGVAPAARARTAHGFELLFRFVLRGSLVLACDGRREERLAAGDACVVPAGLPYGLDPASDDLELLEVTVPAPAAATRGG